MGEISIVANKFKKLLSYFKDVSLEQTYSEFNPHLEVLLVNGRHQLITEDAIYSFEDKYDNFYESFKKVNWPSFHPQRVLVLGLGLGSVIYILEKKFNLKFEYTAVEIDAEIVRMAHKYTLSQLDSYVEVMLVDAMDYLNITSDKYDMILMDIFQSAEIPVKFQSIDFLQVLQSRLNSEGLLMYNRMNVNSKDKNSNTRFEEEFGNVFENYQIIPVKDNLMFVSDRKFLH